MADEIAKLENKTNKAVKVALLISGAVKRRFGKLKDNLVNNYLLGTDRYPNILKKHWGSWATINQQRAGCPIVPAQTTRAWPSFREEEDEGAEPGEEPRRRDQQRSTWAWEEMQQQSEHDDGMVKQGPKDQQQGGVPLLPL
jgi:hypothetical protein